MAEKERIDPTVGSLDAPAVDKNEPQLVEPTVEALSKQAEALEDAGAKPVEFDDSDAHKQYLDKVDEIARAAHAQMEKTAKEAEDLISISQRAIQPDGRTPYDSYGEPLDLDLAADMRLAQIALQDEETAKKFFEKFVERVGKRNAPTITPLVMSNISLLLVPENLKDVKEVAPKYFSESYNLVMANNGKTLLESAGFSQDVISRLDDSFLRYMGATQRHERAFPVEGPALADRLKEPSIKDSILDALANKNVQRSLKWAGLIASCATGGIVVKAGMAGSKFLLGKLAENDHVKAFASKLESRSISFVSQTFGINESKLRKQVDQVKGKVQSVFNNKWVALAGSVALIGVAVGLGHIDVVHDAAQNVAGRFGELMHGGFELVSPSDGLIRQTISPEYLAETKHVTPDIAAHVSSPSGVANVGDGVKVAVPDTHQSPVSAGPAPVEVSAARNAAQAGIPPEVRFPAGTASVAVGGVHDAVPPTVAHDVAPGAVAPAQVSAPVTAGVGDAAHKGLGVHAVQPHDTVSDIAQKELQARGIPATRENIYKLVDQIHEHNKDVIGANVDRIFPGQNISLAFEPKDLNLGHHAPSVAAHAPANQGLDVSASRTADAPSIHSPRSILGVNKDQMLGATTLNALNLPQPMEESATLAAAARSHADVADKVFPASKPLVPNLAMAGSSSIGHSADVDQVMHDYHQEVKARDAAEAQDKLPKRSYHGEDGLSR
jgi:hypothetical protein